MSINNYILIQEKSPKVYDIFERDADTDDELCRIGTCAAFGFEVGC